MGEDPAGIPFSALEKRLAHERASAFPALDDGSRYFARYLREPRKTDPKVLDTFEQEFPGTREVFESGPYGSSLWEALSCRSAESARALADKITDDIRAGVRIEHRVTVFGKPGIQDALAPASLARRLNIDNANVLTASKEFARWLKQDPDLIYRLAAPVGGGALSDYAEGALIQVQPQVTYSPAERSQAYLPVTAPVLTSFSLQLLQSRIRSLRDGQPLLVGRQLEIETHLLRFGLSLIDFASMTGVGFYQISLLPARRLLPVSPGSDSAGTDSSTTAA
jgi:hypothetical protein